MFNSSNEMYYTVQPNDTLSKIARNYQVTVDDLIKANPQMKQGMLRIGQVIRISQASSREKIRNTFRMLWEQHGAWTRMVISSLVFNAPDTEFAVKRLLRNPKDFAKVLRFYYGDTIANQFDKLLTDHLAIAADLVKVAKAGNAKQAEDIEKRWYQNATDIATLLSQINPYLPFPEWEKMMFEHLGFVKTEAVDLLNKEYQKSIDTYDKMEMQILEMADHMTQGIMKQFNIA